ncbi:hypothetical protein GQ53DRAFT_73294 [Thozetella sp. PMI_491]|nr:hypothetical protein GQ53DRAFT_73294 [Thozetella sp. PMI_491]
MVMQTRYPALEATAPCLVDRLCEDPESNFVVCTCRIGKSAASTRRRAASGALVPLRIAYRSGYLAIYGWMRSSHARAKLSNHAKCAGLCYTGKWVGRKQGNGWK